MVTDGPETEIEDAGTFFPFVIEAGLYNVISSFLELPQYKDLTSIISVCLVIGISII